jgi:hypothetical protein
MILKGKGIGSILLIGELFSGKYIGARFGCRFIGDGNYGSRPCYAVFWNCIISQRKVTIIFESFFKDSHANC